MTGASGSSDAERGERIQKVLSRAGVSSRREAERLIQAGRVKVNGRVVTELGTRVTAADELRVDENLVDPEPDLRYVVLHKPAGMLTTLSDPEGRPTVAQLLPDDWGRLYPVGRLDWGSEGVLLMTNDGELANRMMHPRYGVERVYEVKVQGRLALHDPKLAAMRRGVDIGEGQRGRAKFAEVVGSTGKNTWLRVVLAEGKNREVRRICQAVELDVMRLKRISYATLSIDGLVPGAYRELTPHEVRQLVTLVKQAQAKPAPKPRAAPTPRSEKSRPKPRGSSK